MPWDVLYNDTNVDELLQEPVPWIGMYIGAASLVCTLGMAADAFHGFWNKKYWFPSKYFSLNATSLTLLAVALKLPVDLTTRMYAITDRLAKISSLVFMSTAMANFLTSLGAMTDQDVLMNVTALGILVVTVTVNVMIQVIQLHAFLSGRLAFCEEVLAIGSMLLLLVMFISSALMIPSTKRYLETKYREMHKSALEEEEVSMGRVTTDKLRVLIKKYWLMAETSTPQFVIARSVTCTTSGAVCLLIAFILLQLEIRLAMEYKIMNLSDSNYGWSTKWILLSQTLGVIVGTIAPASRWFIAIRFRFKNKGHVSIQSAFMVEGYWTQKMVEWKHRSLSLNIRRVKFKKVVHDLRGLFLKFCIFSQFLIVLTSKLLLIISVGISSPAVFLLSYITSFKSRRRISHSDTPSCEENAETEALNIGHYVMLLEGEVELPEETLENICKEVDKVIRKGKMRKPRNLLKLLYRSCNFAGATNFNCREVPNLNSQELPCCWSLPVVTLTSIALALPNVEKQKSRCLLNSVTEGLIYVNLIDKELDRKGRLANIRTAADVAWVGVELYHMWQDKDLHETSLKGKNAADILQELCDKAEKIVLEFKKEDQDCLMKNPLNWPANVIAANSMHRICRMILLDKDEPDEELFEKLSIMISDIMVACLTNLTHVITKKCHRNAIEERERSVCQAALLLGETEDIIALLQQSESPILAPDWVAGIEDWQALMKQECKNNPNFISRTATSKSQEDHTTTQVQLEV